MNHKTDTKERKGKEREETWRIGGAGRERESVERALVVIASEQAACPLFVFLCGFSFVYFFPFFCFAALIYPHLGLLCS